LEEVDGKYLHRHLLRGSPCGDYVSLVWTLLRAVRGTNWMGWKEVNAEEVRGGWGRSVAVSVLAAFGIHANRSVYVLAYERTRTSSMGYPPDLRSEVAARLREVPEAQAELEVLEKRLIERHPELGVALERTEGLRETLPFFVKAIRRGHLLFLFTPAFQGTHVVLDGTLVPLSRGCHYWDVERERNTKALAKFLRENSPLRVLPHGAIPALLRGEGSPKEAARLLVLARLGEL